MNRTDASARSDRGVAAGFALAGAAGLRVLERFPSGGLCDVLQPFGAVDAGKFRAGVESGAVRPLLSQHHLLVLIVLAGQLVLSTLAAYAFARFKFRGSGIAFALVLLQLMIMPDVLIVENYRVISALGLLDTIPAIGLPYLASAFGSSCCGRRLKAFRRSWSTRRASRARARCKFSGGSMYRWRGRPTLPLALSRSATTGTISSGR